jgi:hypothetical protein
MINVYWFQICGRKISEVRIFVEDYECSTVTEFNHGETCSNVGSACHLLHAGFSLGLFFDPDDGGDMFLRNIGLLSADYRALYPRR